MCNTGGCWVKLPLRMLSLLVWKWEFTLLLAVPWGLIFVSVNFLVLYSAAHIPPFLSSPVFFYLGVTSFITRLIFLLSFLFFSSLRGLFITIHDKGHIATMLNSWPEENIKVCSMCSVDWEITGSLGKNGIFSGTAWHHLQNWLLKRTSKECFPSSENFHAELQFSFNFQSSWDFRDSVMIRMYAVKNNFFRGSRILVN